MTDVRHELRVLAGPQAGAAIALAPGATIDVGSLSASGCQIVLRDPRVSEQRLRLLVREDDVRIDVLVGTIDLAGQILAAPCTIAWPHFLPVTVGDTVMAVGTPDSDRWDHVLAVAAAAPRAHLPAPPPPSPEPDPATLAAAPLPAARRRLETWLALGGGAVCAAALALMGIVSLATPAARMEAAGERLEKLLLAPEFSGLRVRREAGDRFQVTGSVLTLADRTRLDRTLAEAQIDADLDVQVGEKIAEAVQDVFRIQGVPAEVTVPTSLADVGRIQVRTRTADLARLQRVETVARQDVRGVKALDVANTPPTLEPTSTPVPDDPGKRVASIVPGDSPYVVTADGTRYFVGALLPSGHRLLSIGDSEVQLEKDGRASALRF